MLLSLTHILSYDWKVAWKIVLITWADIPREQEHDSGNHNGFVVPRKINRNSIESPKNLSLFVCLQSSPNVLYGCSTFPFLNDDLIEVSVLLWGFMSL